MELVPTIAVESNVDNKGQAEREVERVWNISLPNEESQRQGFVFSAAKGRSSFSLFPPNL